MMYYWTAEEVYQKLDQKMTAAFHAVHKMAKEHKGTQPARCLSCGRAAGGGGRQTPGLGLTKTGKRGCQRHPLSFSSCRSLPRKIPY
jgi:Glutamate dehydrogenase/leucine dehydrogenase